LRRAVGLALELCPGARTITRAADVYAKKPKKLTVKTSWDMLHRTIGAPVPKAVAEDILRRLGFGVRSAKTLLTVSVPTWRATKDISGAEDIAEEILRIYGYARIPSALPAFPITPPPRDPAHLLEYRLKEIFALECGYAETSNYSFVSGEWADRCGMPMRQPIALDNPIASDRPLLRQSLLPGVLENMESNLHRYDAVRLCETGRTYHADVAGLAMAPSAADRLPGEIKRLALGYAAKGAAVPFYPLAHAIDSAFRRAGIACAREPSATPPPWAHPGRAATVLVGGKPCGIIAEVHPSVSERIGIEGRVAIAEFDMRLLAAGVSRRAAYASIPPYPSVTRDIALVVSRSVSHAQMVQTIRAASRLVSDAALFDVYEGEGIAPDKKSVAYHIVYLSRDKTLGADDVAEAHRAVEEALKRDCGADVRR
jgi:phenylalanyl-tRNA synthetase beta chain